MGFMLIYPTNQIIRHAYVYGIVGSVCHNIHIVHHKYFFGDADPSTPLRSAQDDREGRMPLPY